MVRAPPRVLPRSRALFGFLVGGGGGPVPFPPTWLRAPRSPWGGCGRGDPSPTPLGALLRAGFARCGGGTRVRGGGASCLGVGCPGLHGLPPPTSRPFRRAAGAHYPLAVVAVCGRGGPAVLGTFSRAAVRHVLCPLPGFAAPGGCCGLVPVLVPWLWPAACLSGVPRGTALVRRASSGPVALGAPVGFPVAVVPSPTLGAVAGFTGWLRGARGGRLRTGLFVPAAGPCRGKGARRAPRRTRSGPWDGVVPGRSLRLRSWAACAAVVLACVDPVTDASGVPYRPSFDGGLGRCTGAVSCGRRHLPFWVRRRHARVLRVCVYVLLLAGSGKPASQARSGVPHLFLWLSCPSSLFGHRRAGVARALGVFFAFFPFSFPFLPCPPWRPHCLWLFVLPGPGCPAPRRSLFLLRSPPPRPVFFSSCVPPPTPSPQSFVLLLLVPWALALCCAPPPPSPSPFFLLFLPRCVLPSLCPLFAPPLSRRFRFFRPWMPWALALSRLSPLFLFFFRSSVVVLPSRFSWFRALLVLLASGPPDWVPFSFSVCGRACGACAVCRGCRPRRSLLVLPCCLVRAGRCCVLLPVVAGWSLLGLVCRLLFSAGVLWRGLSRLAAWLAALLCALGCCGIPLPCAVSCVLWLCVAVWRRAVVPCCPFCLVLWSVWRCVAPLRRLWCVVLVFGWCSVSPSCAPGCSLLGLVACLPCCFVRAGWCCVLLPVDAGCSLLGLVACCCFPLECVVSAAPAWPRALLPCCVLWFVVVPCSSAPCPVFCGAVLPCGAGLWRAAVRLCLLVVLVCVLPRCVRCLVALCIVLFGAGLVCPVVGASRCGVSL